MLSHRSEAADRAITAAYAVSCLPVREVFESLRPKNKSLLSNRGCSVAVPTSRKAVTAPLGAAKGFHSQLQPMRNNNRMAC
jgi:hypothetical protein